MNNQPAPIQTRAYGRLFRSRTEARWAVAFTTARIEWVYEMEGYDLSSGPYLPDFWLPQVSMWAEVKGSGFSLAELHKANDLANATGYSVLLLLGQPADLAYWAIEPLEKGIDSYWSWPLSDGTKVSVMDYSPFDGSYYHLSEKRFFACCGASIPEDFPAPVSNWNDSPKTAIDAAMSARFEHGEEPK